MDWVLGEGQALHQSGASRVISPTRSAQQPNEVGTVLTPILQVRKPKLNE